MQSISQLVKERNNQEDVQRARAKPVAPKDLQWVQCRAYIDSLPNNYLQLVNECIANKPLSVKKRAVSRGGCVIEITLKEWSITTGPIDDPKTYHRAVAELYILEDSIGAMKKVEYQLWSTVSNKCYIRDLLDPKL